MSKFNFQFKYEKILLKKFGYEVLSKRNEINKTEHTHISVDVRIYYNPERENHLPEVVLREVKEEVRGALPKDVCVFTSKFVKDVLPFVEVEVILTSGIGNAPKVHDKEVQVTSIQKVIKPEPEEDLVSYREVQKKLEISRVTLFKYVKQLNIKTVRGGVGNRERFIERNDIPLIKEQLNNARSKGAMAFHKRSNRRATIKIDQSKYLSTNEAAKFIGISRSNLEYITRNKIVESVKLGKYRYILKESAEQYKQARAENRHHRPRGGYKKPTPLKFDPALGVKSFEEASRAVPCSLDTFRRCRLRLGIKAFPIDSRGLKLGVTEKDIELIRGEVNQKRGRYTTEVKMKDVDLDTLCSVGKAQQILDVSRSRIYGLIHEGKLKPIVISGIYFIPEEQLTSRVCKRKKVEEG